MKKFIVSVGLVAAGAASVQMVRADGTTEGGGVDSKVWAVSASLRGFYDDNYATTSKKVGSYGFEVTPDLSVSAPLGQTEIGLRYIYGLYYYQKREELNEKAYDQTHQVDLWLDHAFNERWHGKIADTLAVGQEPALINAGTPYRVNGNNIANTATASLDTDWTRELSTSAIYTLGFYDFSQDGVTNANTSGVIPSLAGELNRIENSIELDLKWHLDTQTTLFVGYTFEQVNYTKDQQIGYSVPLGLKTGNPFYTSKDRDNRSHYVYVGAEHDFLANLSVSARAGFQYNDTYNDPLSSSQVTPYANLSATYTYLPGSYVQLGFTHALNATDVSAVNAVNGTITQNQETSTVYGSINHHITADLLASIVGQWQNSSFSGGAFNNDTENDYGAGVSLTYNISRHFSCDAGYNYDKLQDSNIANRGYERNRVYVGVSAAY
jgi:hypothetical protein